MNPIISLFSEILICLAFLSPVIAEARIKFLHIPKCGGTTIDYILGKQFNQNEIYPFKRLNGAIAKNARSRARDLPKFEEELISGHFPFWFLEEKDPDHETSFTFTVLRDPIERVLSHYQYRKKNNPEINVTIDDVHSNWMCKMLCSDPSLPDHEILESAIENLHKLDYVVFLDTFEKDARLLFDILGIDRKNYEFPNLNRSEKVKYTKKLIEKIRNSNQLDIQLYKYAKMYIKNSPNKYEQSYIGLREFKEKRSDIDYTFDQPLLGEGWSYRIYDQETNQTIREIRGDKAIIFFRLEKFKEYLLTLYLKSSKKSVNPIIEVNNQHFKPKKYSENGFLKYEVVLPKEVIDTNFTKFIVTSDYLDKDLSCFSFFKVEIRSK